MGDIARDLKSDATHALVIGTKVFVNALSADGKPFVFTRDQMEFFLALQKLKAVQPAALSIDKDEEWATRFLSSKKFKAFVNAKMQELQIKNGITLEWWYQFGKTLSEGKRSYYGGFCAVCKKENELTEYEAEAFRDDDMVIQAQCPDCETPLTLQKKTEAFKPSREQVEGWKELGSRIIPKIERVNHEFSREEIVFEVSQ